MSGETFMMAYLEDTLSGNLRLALLAFGDSNGVASVKTVARWCNTDLNEAQDIIDELLNLGWVRFGYVPFYDFEGYYHPDMIAAFQRRDQAIPRQPKPKAASPVKWAPDKSKRSRIYERDGHRCHYCGSNQRLSLDHIIPRSKGGTHEDENLVTCCKSCNSAKGIKSYDEFWETLE